jgi:hypothetical protein
MLKDEIYSNQDSLVRKCLKENIFNYEDIKNLFNKEDEEYKEVLEWWLVSSWLCNKLNSKGEVIISNEYGNWWGRTTSGQAIKFDEIIVEIFEK